MSRFRPRRPRPTDPRTRLLTIAEGEEEARGRRRGALRRPAEPRQAPAAARPHRRGPSIHRPRTIRRGERPPSAPGMAREPVHGRQVPAAGSRLAPEGTRRPQRNLTASRGVQRADEG